MDHQWRPMQYTPPPLPPQATVCPTCLISHFPFCPPYPPPCNQTARFPPPPPYPQPDPFNPAPPGHHPTNNFDYRDSFVQQQHLYDNHNGFVETRSNKRVRADSDSTNSINSTATMVSFDNERRLKLIRDHGGGGANYINVGYSSRDFELGFRNNDNNSNHNKHNVDTKNHQFQYFSSHNHDQHQAYGFYNNVNLENWALGGHHHQQPPPPPPPPPPPFPASPPPPVPVEPPPTQTGLFPVSVSSSSADRYLHNNPSASFMAEEWRSSSMTKRLSPEKPTVVDAFKLFKQPYRATRPDHFVIILRGLPGSGKSYLAKMIRDLEVENGGSAPRIHSMDDYFMTEVEKVGEGDTPKSSSSGKGKKRTVKKVMEYCYEPEMEEAYRDSMLKAFKKTLEEGTYALVIVDDRNLRVADFAQFWAIAKRSGYEVYISESTYKDPVGCAARNVHGFTLDEIKNMAEQWEEAPTLYLQLDVKSLFHGDDLKESGIQEVDMDTEDGTSDDSSSRLKDRKAEKARDPPLEDDAPEVLANGGKRWDAEEDRPSGGSKGIAKSKWSDDLDEDNAEGSEGVKGNSNALSGLIQAYGKRGKSVCWSDQAWNIGFSIVAAKKNKSLVIGPGAGYNVKSNPLPEDGSPISSHVTGESKRHDAFQERMRAERESFKAVFDKRRRRIGGLNLDEE